MKQTKINTYACCRSPYVQSSIGIDEVIEEIRSGTQFGKLIEQARGFGKGSEEFEQIKVNQIGTYTVNAVFDRYRKEACIISPTGLLYVDVDNVTEIDLSHPLIFAAFRSVSATGYTIIVKVANLTVENIKPVYTYVGQELGVQLDSSCAEMSRQTVFSYDPNIEVNYESKELDALQIQTVDRRYISPLLNLEEKRGSRELYPYGYDGLVYNQNHLFDFGDRDFILFEDKIPTVEVYIPRIIKTGNRNTTIFTIATNMCFLNPQLRGRRLYGFLLNLNSRCDKPLGRKEMDGIYRKLSKMIDDASITPTPTRLRKIVFSPNCPVSVRNKMTAVAAGRVRSEKTFRKVKITLDDWDLSDGIITNRKIASKAGVHLNTVKKYLKHYPELKTEKEEINKVVRQLMGNT